ncbi:Fungal specific transcription factor domain-containing protein 43 [Elsinoe fawcettii]|nr:Fungal specific transcription factor domain-containing protein 43 [Elsinoe fawcettii]
MAAVSTHNPAPVQSMMDPTDLQGSEDPLYHHANMSRSFFGPFFGEPFGPDEWLAVEDFNADLIPTDFAIGVDLGPGPQCDTFAGVLGTQDAQVQAAQRQLPLSPHAEGQADAFESGTHTPSDPDGIRPRKYYASAIEFDAQLIFPDLRKASLADIDDEDFAHVEAIDDTLSKRVFELAESLQNKPSFPRFLDLRPPPASVLNAWVQVYFENFHPIFPFLHKASFVPSKTHWLLMFAVSAIGAHFSKIPDAQACSRAMHEVIRRQTLHLCEIDNSNGRTLWMTQTILLNQIGLMYCGERRGLEIAELYQGLTVTLARRLGLFPRQQAAHRRPPLPSRNTSQSWDHTVMSELRHRTAYATWLVDGALAVDFELSPLMRAAELTIPLPQAESRWESNDAGSWASYSVAAEHGERLTMSDVMSHNDWKAAWQKSGTLGRYAIIQCLSTRSRSETNLSEQFLCDQQISETLTSLLDLVESQETSSSLLDLRALIPHKFMLTMALANADLPPDSLSAILLDSIYGRMFPSAWDEIAQRWLQSPSQGRLAVFYAARTFQLIKASRCAHFSAPVYALRATLILWLYSTIASSCPTLLSAKGSPVLIGHRRLVEMSDVAWIEKGWSRVKLPAIGNLISEQGRYKLLEEATATLHSLRAWGISLTYAELVKRLISATIPHMATNLHKTDD